MEAKIGKFFESMGSFFTGGDHIPWSDGDIVVISGMMRQIAVTVATLLLVALEIPTGLTLPSIVPAFLWSPLEDGLFTLCFIASTLSCSGKEAQQHSVDVAILFVGREVGIQKS
ncbi:hypothetical protein RHMOL_Rhmol01G0246400 [Rhododendron molle]|uniref:Uncharacterized protein n=1 Tax=Rhododendron molle TaxID=49168 RepID=A0ACC0Q6G8_RHOML|nr:hypothetical protein RHMOL_Rhmol01G0246400 [Rhododendron molle]